ncbi:MAG: GAF domain-containing protein [Anaerolineae bacterium]|nr:GAF domain-containing protein [Anaerolineae bacterium]
MWALFEVSKILSSPLGSLVYHLLLLLTIEAVLGMAWEEWRRTRRGLAQRLFISFGGMVLVRLGYVVAALLAMAGWADRTMLLPPLERFADTASLALIAWALIPAASLTRSQRGAHAATRWPRTRNLLLAANLILALAACIASIAWWGQELAAAGTGTLNPLDYNLSWQATVWSSWQIGLAILVGLAASAASANRDEGWTESWPVSFLAVVVILAGRIMQLVTAAGIVYTTASPHLPVWERLANLIAYPLLVVALYQNIVVGLRLRSRQLQDISQASMDQIKSLLFLFEASREMSSSLDLPTVLDNAAQGIARALDADQCAIAFPQDNDPGQMRLAAIHNPARHGRGEGVAFPLDYQLAVQQAMRRKRYVIVEEADNVQLKVLFALLGSSDIGPLLIQPLVSENEAIGAIIVGNSRSQRPFTANEAKLCQSMADQVVGAIQNARRYRTLQAANEETARSLTEERRASQQARAQTQDLTDRLASVQAEIEEIRRREETAREARNALEIKLVSSRAESESLTDRLAMLESDLAQTHANAEAQLNWHKIELARQEAAWQEALQSQERLQIILHSLTAGLIIADRQGRIIEANVASEILLDRDTEELKGTDLRTVSDDPRWKQAVLTASGGDAPAVRLTIAIGANTLLCDIAPIPASRTGNVSGTEAGQDFAEGIIVVMQDISAEVEEYQGRGTIIAQIASKAQELQSSLATAANYANLVLSDIAGAETAIHKEQRSAVGSSAGVSTWSGSQRGATSEADLERNESQGAGGHAGPTEIPARGVAAAGAPSAERTIGAARHKFLLRLRTSVERTAQMADDLVHLATGSPARHRSADLVGKHAGSLATEGGLGPSHDAAQSATAQAKWAAVDINHLIETAVADSEPQLKAKDLVVDLELPDSLPAVEVNLNDLRQVMANLLLNAYLVSPTGGRIQVQASHSPMPHAPGDNGDSFVIISVRDSGGGMPYEALDQVFDQARPGRTPRGLGASGADLALVKTLVESQRGHLWVETENGVGTTFNLALPIEERG